MLVAYAIVAAIGRAPLAQSLLGLFATVMGLLTFFQVARRGIAKAIWRLRNRLIAAYLLIAVVPVVLILMLVAMAGYAVIGQMAVYLVNTELKHREDTLLRQADGSGAVPGGRPRARDEPLRRRWSRNSFPNFELLATGTRELRYPDDCNDLTHPPAAWNTRANELDPEERRRARSASTRGPT